MLALLTGAAAMASLAAVAALAPPAHGAGLATGKSWYVRAGAATGGSGAKRSPFDHLSRAERRSRAGDRIVILHAPRDVPPLDGGILLKPRQKLIGAGPPVQPRSATAPRVTNTTSARHSGDAVVLADGATVRNLEIVAARRGGIYGRDVRNVVIRENDVSGHNTSCTPGFHIPPFSVPTTVPGVGIPISDGLHNGWAGIMLDASRRKSGVKIRGNRVHHAECGDGIDIRASGSAQVHASISDNVVDHLRQGDAFESVLAFGLQTRAGSRLVATLDGNRQRDLGNDGDLGAGPTGADSEGVFLNPSGRSTMRATVVRNTYTHRRGSGGFSANGLEFVSMGDGARAKVVVRDSTFSGTPGDVLEQLALGTNAHLELELDRVVATGSTGFSGTGIGDTIVIPGNNADCLISASGGAGNTVEVTVRRSELTNCANNGLTLGSAVTNGSGPTTALRLDVADSQITGNRGANLRIGNLAALERLEAKVENTNLAESHATGSSPANVVIEDLGTTGRAAIDLGGGPLGSRGGNCLHGGALAAALVRYHVHARNNWWGSAGGPLPGRVVTVGGSLEHAPGLGAPPAGC